MMSEKELQVQVQNFLAAHGYKYFHIPADARYRILAGFLDLCIIGHGQQFWIELKSPMRKIVKLREKQQEFCDILAKNEIAFFVSNDLDEICDFILVQKKKKKR